jgi:hypothetical protein
MMKMWKEKGGEEFCANEPHSAIANSLHSLEVCENLADKKSLMSGCQIMSVIMNGLFFLGVGQGMRDVYVLLDKKVQCLPILKCLSLPFL